MNLSKSIIVTIALALLIMPIVSAFAITTFYWEPDNALYIKPGDSTDVFFQLQNMVGSQDMTVKATITSGSDIAEITDPSDIYIVPAGRKDINVNIHVKIPATDPIGKKYAIGLSVKEVKESQGKTVEFDTSIGSSVPIIVGETPSPPQNVATYQPPAKGIGNAQYLIGAAVLVVVVIALLFLRKKKTKKR